MFQQAVVLHYYRLMRAAIVTALPFALIMDKTLDIPCDHTTDASGLRLQLSPMVAQLTRRIPRGLGLDQDVGELL